jgi:hypothetical protein
MSESLCELSQVLRACLENSSISKIQESYAAVLRGIIGERLVLLYSV